MKMTKTMKLLCGWLVAALLVVPLPAGVAWGAGAPIEVTSKPCDSEGDADDMEVVAYRKGRGTEGYLIFRDVEGLVVAPGGNYRVLINEIPQASWKFITCKDFKTFATGSGRMLIGFVFFVPNSNPEAQEIVIEFYNTLIHCRVQGTLWANKENGGECVRKR